MVPRFWHIALAACAQACVVAPPAHVAPVAGATTARPQSGDLTRSAGKGVLVVGHSNTVPDIVQSLSGSAVPAITDAEYDHIFVVVIPASGSPRLMQLRFGSPGP